jgi:hypothetical protein
MFAPICAGHAALAQASRCIKHGLADSECPRLCAGRKRHHRAILHCGRVVTVLFIRTMKSILSIAIAISVLTPALFADDSKTCDTAKTACCEKAKATECTAKATECTSAKKGCPKEAALRQALLRHKGAWVAQR